MRRRRGSGSEGLDCEEIVPCGSRESLLAHARRSISVKNALILHDDRTRIGQRGDALRSQRCALAAAVEEGKSNSFPAP